MRLNGTEAHPRPRKMAAFLRPGPGLAIAMVLLSSLCYSLGYALTKRIIAVWHFDAMQLFVLRSLLVCAGFALMSLFGRRPLSLARLLAPPQARVQRLAATALVLSAVLAMIGYAHLAVTTATAFSFTTPLLVTILAALLLREKVPPLRWVAVGLGFAGVLVVLHPGAGTPGQERGQMIGVAAALGSAVLYAAQQLLIRHARDSVTTTDVVAQGALLGLILLGGFMPFIWRPVPASAFTLILLATIAQTGGLFSIAAAIRMGQISQLAPWQYGGMVWAMLLDLTMFGHVPGLLALTGAVMIAAGGLLSQLKLGRSRRTAKVRTRP